MNELSRMNRQDEPEMLFIQYWFDVITKGSLLKEALGLNQRFLNQVPKYYIDFCGPIN